MKNLCRALSWIVLLCGIFGSLYIAEAYGLEVKTSTITAKRNWGLTIGIYIGAMISTLVIFAILGALAKILERLEPKKEEHNEIEQEER